MADHAGDPAAPQHEQATVEATLREFDVVHDELARANRLLASWALDHADVRRLLTIPGVDATIALALVAAIGDVRRFASPAKLVGYLGLDPRVRQSGARPASYGPITKQGRAHARGALVEAAWAAVKTPGPLRACYQRIRTRRGPQIAVVAVARKLAVLTWHLLTRGEDYAFARLWGPCIFTQTTVHYLRPHLNWRSFRRSGVVLQMRQHYCHMCNDP